jgi:repressor LexA
MFSPRIADLKFICLTFVIHYDTVCIIMKTQLSKKQVDAVRHIRNWIMHKGKTPSVRELMSALGYKSPRSAALIIEKLIQKSILRKRANGDLQLIKDIDADSVHARTVDIPLVGMVTCGVPILAQENIEGFIPVSVSLAKPGFKYFLLRAKGDSMNKAGINNGDLILVRRQSTAQNGDIVVALIDDEATVKEFQHSKNCVVLMPRSNNKNHKPIILTENFQVQGVAVTTIPNLEV